MYLKMYFEFIQFSYVSHVLSHICLLFITVKFAKDAFPIFLTFISLKMYSFTVTYTHVMYTSGSFSWDQRSSCVSRLLFFPREYFWVNSRLMVSSLLSSIHFFTRQFLQEWSDALVSCCTCESSGVFCYQFSSFTGDMKFWILFNKEIVMQKVKVLHNSVCSFYSDSSLGIILEVLNFHPCHCFWFPKSLNFYSNRCLMYFSLKQK